MPRVGSITGRNGTGKAAGNGDGGLLARLGEPARLLLEKNRGKGLDRPNVIEGGGAVGIRVIRDIRFPQGGYTGVLADAVEYLRQYIVLPEESHLVLAAWTMAAHFIHPEDKGPWDQFPLLAVTSPQRRCGKSTLLDLLAFLTPRADQGKFVNPSPAAFYRAIEKSRPTIIMDESQSLKRRGSESSEVLREMLNASIRRDEYVARCVGDNHEPTRFSLYSPKIFAQIGQPDGVLADRCLPITMKRKTKADAVRKFRYRITKAGGEALRAVLEQWAADNADKVTEVYNALEPFDIDNDRMADLLLPLQAVLIVAGSGLDVLRSYAEALEDRDREGEAQEPSLLLLAAFREVFKGKGDAAFISTTDMVHYLLTREEEPWATYSRGGPITARALADLLREYGIKPEHNRDQTSRGYVAARFAEAWERYLTPPLGKPYEPYKPYAAKKPPGYDEYLASPAWRAFAARVKEHWGGRCAICYRGGPLEVHHRTYERFRRELLTDCLALCLACHALADEARAKGGKSC